MLGGVPAHLLLILVGLGCILGFGASIWSAAVGLALAGAVAAVWLLLVVCYSRDRVAVLAFFLRRKARFNPKIASYSRSQKQVRFE